MSVEVPDTARCTIRGAQVSFGGTVECLLTIYVRNTAGPWSSVALGLLADDAIARVSAASFRAVVSPRCTFTEVEVQDIGTDPYGLASAKAFPAGINGTNAGTQDAPVMTPAVIQMKGDAGGEPRSSFVNSFPLTELQTDGNSTVDVATTDALTNAYSDLLEGGWLPSETGATVIVSRYKGFTLVTQPNDTVTKEPTPRAVGVANTLDTVLCRRLLGRRASRQTSP